MRTLVDEVRKSNHRKRECLKKGMPGSWKERRINVPHEEHPGAYQGDNSQCDRNRPVRPVKTTVHKLTLPQNYKGIAGVRFWRTHTVLTKRKAEIAINA